MTYRLTDLEEIEKSRLWLSKYWDKPIDTKYFNAKTIDEALSLLDTNKKEAKIITGGIDLVGLMKNKVLLPKVLINIKTISKLKYVVENDKYTTIGALTLINDIERSALIRNQYPLLFEAACSVASPQIRNISTIGGNLCQDVRCWYYRRSPVTGVSFNCRRKKENGICYAIKGENENHAIIGGAKCFAVCPSDIATALLALDAKIIAVSANGERTISIDEFYTAFGNTLEPNEIITAIEIPKVGPGVKQRFLKFRLRKTIDFAIASVALVLGLDNGTVRDARLVLGGVSPKPYRAVKAEACLIGKPITEDLAKKAAKLSVNDAKPSNKNSYKVPIVEALVKRSLLE